MSGGEFAGRLGERVTLYRPVPDRDAEGGWTGGIAVIGNAWATVAPDGQGPDALAEARSALVYYRVTLRPRDLRVGDRIGWGATELLIRAVQCDPATPDRMIAFTEEMR